MPVLYVANLSFTNCQRQRHSLAAVELIDGWDIRSTYPALSCCSPHLVEDWAEEAEGAIPGLRAVIVESISELESVVESYQPGDKLAAIISHSQIKMGPGWTPAYS
jgi:hypothetical protein